MLRGTLLATSLVFALSTGSAVAQLGRAVPTPLPAPAQADAPGQQVVAEPVVVRTEDGAVAYMYHELSCYSAHVRRSYVPGYTPHPSSLFENPRSWPAATGSIATPYYQFAGVRGWFFTSPGGYQSSVPPGSHILAYEQGRLEITKNLGRGYPEGKRVVEPILKPVEGVCEKAGILINPGASMGFTAYTAEDCGGMDGAHDSAVTKGAPPEAVPPAPRRYAPAQLDK